MEKMQAFQILSQVCSQVKANLQEHQAIQEALTSLKPEEKKAE
jgi:hypothetical protein